MNPFAATLPHPFRMAEAEVAPLTTEDARALSRLHSSAFPLSGGSWGASEFHKLLLQPNVFGHRVARPGPFGRGKPEPRGFVLLREAGGEAEVLTLAVHPSWQGRGFGRTLMNAAIRDLYGRRTEALFLEVDEGNAPAIGLYEKLGFETVGKREAYYAKVGGRATALTMRLDLKGN